MSRRGFCAAMAMCLAWMGASARGASGTLIEARGILSGQTTAIVTIPSASSGDSTGTVQLSSSSGTGRGRAGITAAGIELGASGVHTGAGFAGGTAIVEDSMGVFNVINTSGFDGAVLKLDLSGSLSSAGGAPAILSVSASDWIRTNGTLGGFSGGQWFYDGSAFWNDFATGNASSIAGLPENGNWFSSGGGMRYDAPLYIPLESFAMNSWNQIKISLTAQANGDSNADFWSTLTFSNEDPVQLIDAVSGNFLTTGAVSGGFSWDSGAGTIPAVPEPSIALLLGLGLVGLAAARRRRARISWISD